MSQWIPVSERLPEKCAEVVVLHATRGRLIACLRTKDGILEWCSPNLAWYDRELVTHWMPLPDQPPRKLTHKEALELAVSTLDRYLPTGNGTLNELCDILPKLREALE